ncbi:kelch-like protein 10 [Argonauta hians]
MENSLTESGTEVEEELFIKEVPKETSNSLVVLRKAGELCDAVIQVGDVNISVHRVILAAACPYFRALFTNSKFESDRHTVNITDISAPVMSKIIDYMYTNACDINDDNVSDILVASDYLNMTHLQELCCDYLSSKISVSTCISIKNFAQKYFCEKLRLEAHKFILHNFTKVYANCEDFQQLDADALHDILKSEDLNIKSEEIAFDAIIKWIDFDPDQRKCHIAKLLRSVRMALLSTNYFVEKVKVHPYIHDNKDCKSLVIEALKILYDLDINENNLMADNISIARPRVPNEIIFVFGGWSGRYATNLMETYDSRANRWMKCKTVKSDFRAYHGSCVLDRFVYIIGGFDGMEYFNSVRRFDTSSHVWKEVGPMHNRRCYVSVAALNNEIYAIGGYNGVVRQKTAERYNKDSNQWSYIMSMNSARSDAAATVLRSRIYICGGFDGIEIFSSAEYYSPSTDQWTLITPMRNLRSGVSVVAHHDFVYALGGFNGVTRINSVERYSPSSNTWQTIQEMDTPRSNFAAVLLEDTIYVIGGYDDLTTIAFVERYDDVLDQWFKVNDMNLHRSALSACVVKDLEDVSKYIFERAQDDNSWKCKNKKVTFKVEIAMMNSKISPIKDTNDLQKEIFSETRHVLVELRESGQLCDGVIKVIGESIYIHRAILSACSPYFRALFTNENFDTNRKEVTITDISSENMRHIIEYAYTQTCQLSSQNVRDIFVAADFFQISGLQKACCEFILSELSPYNCISVKKFSQKYFCYKLVNAAHKYILQNFSEVYKVSEDFLELNIDEVCEIIKYDELNLKSEEIAFEAIIRWINHNPEERKPQIIQLMQYVRFGLLSTQYFLLTVKNHEYLRVDEECKNFVLETLNLLFDLDMGRVHNEQDSIMSRPRMPHDILFAISGWSGSSPTNTVEVYNPRADRWIRSRSVKSDYRAYHGTCILDGFIYVIGGFDGIDYFNSVRSFDPVLQIWSEIAPMYYKRCYVSVAVAGRHIYAMGGSDGNLRQKTVERYNKFKNQWSLIPSMNRHRSDASAAALKDNIYICGGFDGQEILRSVEYYNTNTNQWTMLAPMESIRSGFCVVAYRDAIYALGGFDGNTRMASVERYIPSSDVWRPAPSLGVARSNFAAEVSLNPCPYYDDPDDDDVDDDNAAAADDDDDE